MELRGEEEEEEREEEGGGNRSRKGDDADGVGYKVLSQ